MMDKIYEHKKFEEEIYKLWEKSGAFAPRIRKGQAPFSILLPLPNANDPMHMGHALFTVEDIMIRYHRMLGDPTLWLPGGDHAGIETQFVFEKHLAKQGKSRFDYDRETLYRMIWEFAEKNKNVNKDQMKRLGFSMDWTRYHYSLEPEIVEKVLTTFRKLHADGLVYRGERIVNYCTTCGTAFSELEIEYVERKDPLYYIKYGPFILATTRPETKFGDTGVAYHSGDKRYEKYKGQEIEIMGVNGPFMVKVVADEDIDPEFGTGIEKVTPAHDATDFEIGQRNNLPVKRVINFDGRLNELTGRFAGMEVNEARKAVVAAMQERGLIDHVDENYVHSIATCYKCGTTIEPMTMPQWYVKTKPLAEPAIKAVREGRTKIFPKKRFEKMYFDWLTNIRDWNISRQIVWGPRIPIWYCLECNGEITLSFINHQGNKVNRVYREIKKDYPFEEIRKGLQSMMAPVNATFQMHDGPCEKCKSEKTLQDTDTFDTWFLSGQWPLTTLGANIDNPSKSSEDFKYFYPTSVMDTLWDILFFWVARMMMLGLYITGEVPFKVIHLHARVVDKKGQKMSKSKGNVVNPMEIVEKYGADALRMALVMSVAPASDVAISDDKVRGMRNFANKIWNIGRYVEMTQTSTTSSTGTTSLPAGETSTTGRTKEDEEILKKTEELVRVATENIEKYRFGAAAEMIYEFAWHEFADKYIEVSKERARAKDPAALYTLRHVYLMILKLLHPFMPFVTEAIWGELKTLRKNPEQMLIEAKWPETKSV
jgi:valyl-tRNA synthetase